MPQISNFQSPHCLFKGTAAVTPAPSTSKFGGFWLGGWKIGEEAIRAVKDKPTQLQQARAFKLLSDFDRETSKITATVIRSVASKALLKALLTSDSMAELVDVAGIQLQPHQLDYEVDDESTRQFLDSLDNYITLLDSLSSTLGQGWLQLAGARHSMGATRINSALLNLQPHNAVTQLQVARDQDQPQFSLCKWASCAGIDSGEAEVQDEMQKNFESLTTEDRGSSSSPVEPRLNSSSTKLPTLDAEKQVQRERLKSLAVFGTLVPPRLRDSQLSFEKALETVVEIANAQSSMLYAFGKLQKEVKRREAADKWGNKMDD